MTEDGEEMSTRKIKVALKELISKEEKSKPLSDDALASAMKEQGFPIARRTVAKYREQMGIPVARLRRS
jgi:RNA polymerase sigma-54 factor